MDGVFNAAKADEMFGCPSSVNSRSSAVITTIYETRHAASLFRLYDFSDMPTGTWKKVVCRQVLVQLTSGSPFNNLRNKLQVENRDSQIISISQQQQINSVNNRVCLLFCGSHTCTL